MADQEKILRDEIIKIGRRLYDKDLAVAASGNLSCRLDEENILITAAGSCLGSLGADDIVKYSLKDKKGKGLKNPTSELPLHTLIYDNFSHKAVLHCHPPLINGYFAVASDLKPLTFEARFYLGEVPVVPQHTPTVTEPQPVIEALKTNNLVVLKNHGAVAVSDELESALALIEELEESVRSLALARLFKKDILDELDKPFKYSLSKTKAAYPMFSREHIQAIVDLVNKDEFIAQKGKELGLTVKLAVKLNNSSSAYTFVFEEGKITGLNEGAAAPFVISASKDVWEQVFLGKLDSFVAVTQGKMKLEGQMGQLSRWYVPFSRLFQIFKEVKFSL